MQSPLLSKAEVCLLLRIHPSTLWRLVKAGRLPKPLAISSQVRRWDRNEVEACLRSLAEARQ